MMGVREMPPTMCEREPIKTTTLGATFAVRNQNPPTKLSLISQKRTQLELTVYTNPDSPLTMNEIFLKTAGTRPHAGSIIITPSYPDNFLNKTHESIHNTDHTHINNVRYLTLH